jgi:anti-sigma factor RsiW
MDCRTFHRKLEDYLEGGMDFAARFGMERHAKQCLACEKDVTTAVALRQMARELQRVSAPEEFETALLVRIQTEKAHRRFWKLRSWWFYGMESGSWRVAGVTALVTMLVVGVLTYVHFGRMDQGAVAQAPGEISQSADAGAIGAAGMSSTSGAVSVTSDDGRWITQLPDPNDSDFVDILIPVSGDRQLIFRLPRTIRMRYGQLSQDYFIRNISH